MLTIPQIRAGRAMLGWTQGQLAKAAGLSVRALNMIELGQSLPRQDTLKHIRAALESSGVIFSADGGLRLAADRCEIHKVVGPAAKEALMEDIIVQLRWRGGDCHYIGPYEEEFGRINHKLLDKFYRDVYAYGITENNIVHTGFCEFVARPQCYRWLDPQTLGALAFCVYHDTSILLTGPQGDQIVFIRNAGIAAYFLRQFKMLWSRATVPPYMKYLKETRDGIWTMARAEAATTRVRKMVG